jgi:UDP-N-acetyl-D-mannosaminuronic acid dehydrogenase
MEAIPEKMSECEFVVVIIGTPVDEHLNPDLTSIQRALRRCRASFRNGQVIILRSTVVPGLSEHIRRYFEDEGLDISVAFCPERVAQGYSLREFRTLPQIISAFDGHTLERVRNLFAPFTQEFIELTPREAELSKLMTNAWRYIQFATVNQFYMLASRDGLDFERILHACRHNYPRMSSMPGPGFAAGPCLMKDTMQLAAYSGNAFVLGHAAMLINEGLPGYLVQACKAQIDLRASTAGILGMAFKAESDDPRDSLSYKLRKLLMLEAQRVLSTDPYVSDPELVPLEQVVREANVVFVGAPHNRYRDLRFPETTMVVDVWGITNRVKV